MTSPNPKFVLCVLFVVAGFSVAQAGNSVKVFVLAGQSNMAGAGVVEVESRTVKAWRAKGKLSDAQITAKQSGSLKELAKGAGKGTDLGKLIDSDGSWSVRDDVWIYYDNQRSGVLRGGLTVGYGSRENRIGPELGFGQALGDSFDEPILLIKTAWGGKSLAVDFRPPSAGECDFEIKPDRFGKVRIPGEYYRLMMSQVKGVLENLGQHFPKLQGRNPELAGIFWHQGWNDGCNEVHANEYERNLPLLIADVRKDLGAKELPFVIANSGFGGTRPWGGVVKRLRATVQPAQMAAERIERVRCVDTRPFYRPPERSPGTGDIEHWYSNAESYYLIGQAAAAAMLELMNP